MIDDLPEGETQYEEFDDVYCECNDFPDEEELAANRCKACGGQLA